MPFEPFVQSMELSIIIVNWNTKELLLRCLEALYQAAKRVESEIFVVDNGSTDGSAEAVRQKFPGVRLIENSVNLGFAKANNQALSISGGRYLLLLNPDTQVKEEAIPEMLSFMEAHPDTGIVGAQLLNADGSKQNSIANFPSLATELLNKSLLRWLLPEKFPGKETDFAAPVEVDSVIGACMMVRREAIEQVGFLDENYFLFLEETDWCYRMKKAGWAVYHIPGAEIIHHQGKSAEREKGKARVEYYRSRYHYFKKNKGRLQSVVLYIGLIIKLSVELIFVTIACIFTLFMVKKWRTKFSTYLYLIWWHLRLCPREMGLKSNKKSPLSPLY
ncbi:MAG: glycosyltransferase family 2 protein [Thermodesulfobacteriota bacterium]